MMHMQFGAQLTFVNAAMLAAIAIALAGLTTLYEPVGAVVVERAAAPLWMILTYDILGPPLAVAVAVAEMMIVYLRNVGVDLFWLTTPRARYSDLTLVKWIISAGQILRHPFSLAFRIAEMAIVVPDLLRRRAFRLSTIGTMHKEVITTPPGVAFRTIAPVFSLPLTHAHRITKVTVALWVRCYELLGRITVCAANKTRLAPLPFAPMLAAAKVTVFDLGRGQGFRLAAPMTVDRYRHTKNLPTKAIRRLLGVGRGSVGTALFGAGHDSAPSRCLL